MRKSGGLVGPRRGFMRAAFSTEKPTLVAGRRRTTRSGGLKTNLASSRSRLEMVGLDGLEPTTSVLSGLRSNRLSYRPTGTTIIPIPPPRATQRFASRKFRYYATLLLMG